MLHISRSVTHATFWREIGSKRTKAQPPVIVTRGERDSDVLKLGKPRAAH